MIFDNDTIFSQWITDGWVKTYWYPEINTIEIMLVTASISQGLTPLYKVFSDEPISYQEAKEILHDFRVNHKLMDFIGSKIGRRCHKMAYKESAEFVIDDFLDKAKITMKTGEDAEYETIYGKTIITKHRNSSRYVYLVPEKSVDFSLRTENKGVLVDITNESKAKKGLRKALMRTSHKNDIYPFAGQGK